MLSPWKAAAEGSLVGPSGRGRSRGGGSKVRASSGPRAPGLPTCLSRCRLDPTWEQEDRAAQGVCTLGPAPLGLVGPAGGHGPLSVSRSPCSPAAGPGGGLCSLQGSLCQEPGLRVLPHPPDCHLVSGYTWATLNNLIWPPGWPGWLFPPRLLVALLLMPIPPAEGQPACVPHR